VSEKKPDCPIPILVVEDDELQIATLERLLEGYVVEWFSSAEQAWQRVEKMAVNETFIMLLDWLLPEMSGLELCRRIRQYGHHEHAYIIMLTGLIQSSHEDHAYRAGANEYLKKPFSAIGLRWRLKEACNRLKLLTGLIEEWSGVLNRKAILERLSEEISRAKRGNKLLSLLAFDIDHFKSINDRYGYDVGTAAMAALTHTIHASLRTSDKIGRYGGDEFLVIMPDCGKTKAWERAQVILRRVGQTGVTVGNTHIPLTVSLGITSWQKRHRQGRSITVEQMLSTVLIGLREAKARRNAAVAK
jgi:two-component system, cell cycle response regulator